MKLLVCLMFVGMACAGTQRVVGTLLGTSSLHRVSRASVTGDVEATVLRFEDDVRPDGYNYAYETSNGIAADASGVLKQAGGEVASIVAQGQYKYTAPDGTPVHVTFVADENGYQPSSNLLPVPPAIPAAIQRSLEYISQHPDQSVKRH